MDGNGYGARMIELPRRKFLTGLGALMGAGAEQAVLFALERCIYAGGAVQVVRLKGQPGE